jgi:GNAT superfamily N-acetyltransferase
MAPTVTLRIALPEDADTLAAVSKRAFDSDVDIGAPWTGGPPGYDEPDWQRRSMRIGDYYALLVDGTLAGGAVVVRKAPTEHELARLFVDPDFHRQGVGTRAMALLFERYPETTRWTLDTPTWNQRTRTFYERLGFTEHGLQTLEDGFELTLYELRTQE